MLGCCLGCRAHLNVAVSCIRRYHQWVSSRLPIVFPKTSISALEPRMDARCLDPRGFYATSMILTLGSKGNRSSPGNLYHYIEGIKAFASQQMLGSLYSTDLGMKKTSLQNDYIVLYRLRKRMEKTGFKVKAGNRIKGQSVHLSL